MFATRAAQSRLGDQTSFLRTIYWNNLCCRMVSKLSPRLHQLSLKTALASGSYGSAFSSKSFATNLGYLMIHSREKVIFLIAKSVKSTLKD